MGAVIEQSFETVWLGVFWFGDSLTVEAQAPQA